MRLVQTLFGFAASLVAFGVLADAAPSYREPSNAIRAVLDAPGIPVRIVDPANRTLALVEVRRHPTLAEVSRPFVPFAGARLDPASNGPDKVGHISRLSLRELLDPRAPERVVALPEDGDFYGLEFSPDGRRFVLRRRTDQATELWAGDVAGASVRQVPGVRLVAAPRASIDWLSSDELVAVTVDRARGAVPAKAAVATAPLVKESYGRKSPEATYQDLLRNPFDEAIFDYYATGELTRIELATLAARVIGKPGVYAEVSVIGGGRGLMVERIVHPYSHAIPGSGFGRVVEVLDLEGKAVRPVGRIALRENVPIGGVVQGPRNFQASPLDDGALYWAEALDGGDPRRKVAQRDRLMRLDPPYDGAPREVLRTTHRLAGLQALSDGRAFVTEYDRDRVWVKTFLADLTRPGSEPQLLFDLSQRDRYNAPGSPQPRVLANGRRVIEVKDGQVLFFGVGAGPEGERPFVDRWQLAEGRKVRLFQSDASHYELPLLALDAGGERLLTQRESATEPPNLMLREGTSAPRALTSLPDPTPQLRAITRELVKFKRKDGVDLSFWLYRPAGLKPGEKRPTLLWAYPQEFTDATLAGQVSGSPNRFLVLSGLSPVNLVLDGFVVLDDVRMPVVGNPETVNNTFIDQITMNAEAAVAKAAELGVTDPARVAVGGHSYGAFMTANLLAHTDLFKTGIARSGAYNRTLTPFGFQAERRTLWEAPEAYLKLSPFLVAQKINEPILLIHGELDNNPGTFPEQSERLFAALSGVGGNVRFVKLPAESHGYAARESVGHVQWEMSEWLRKYLGEPRPAP
ncbi:hypothetical protein BWI17_05665 [Betaproteobacteria bacterium GR16-43]|nr:hypothetical protein BWI17_05665 [Betaproteobacteria bacterium GR16-43]